MFVSGCPGGVLPDDLFPDSDPGPPDPNGGGNPDDPDDEYRVDGLLYWCDHTDEDEDFTVCAGRAWDPDDLEDDVTVQLAVNGCPGDPDAELVASARTGEDRDQPHEFAVLFRLSESEKNLPICAASRGHARGGVNRPGRLWTELDDSPFAAPKQSWDCADGTQLDPSQAKANRAVIKALRFDYDVIDQEDFVRYHYYSDMCESRDFLIEVCGAVAIDVPECVNGFYNLACDENVASCEIVDNRVAGAIVVGGITLTALEVTVLVSAAITLGYLSADTADGTFDGKIEALRGLSFSQLWNAFVEAHFGSTAVTTGVGASVFNFADLAERADQLLLSVPPGLWSVRPTAKFS